MCLDGSPPAYYMRAGFGDGASKWLLHLKGGGWCASTPTCYERISTAKGSSLPWRSPLKDYPTILSNNSEVNPDFHNWNTIVFIYCDGGAFLGDRQVLNSCKTSMLT